MSDKNFADAIRESLIVNENVSFDYNSLFIDTLKYGYHLMMDSAIEHMKTSITSLANRINNIHNVKEIGGCLAVGVGPDFVGGINCYHLSNEMLHSIIKKATDIELPDVLIADNALYVERYGEKLFDFWPEAQDVWKNLLTKGTTTSIYHQLVIPLRIGSITVRRYENRFMLIYSNDPKDFIQLKEKKVVTGFFNKTVTYVYTPCLTDFGKKVVKDITKTAGMDGIIVEPKIMKKNFNSYDSDGRYDASLDEEFVFDKPKLFDKQLTNYIPYLGLRYYITV